MTTALLDVYLTDTDRHAELRSDVGAGLTAVPKVLAPKWFYDATGSKIYQRITELPEYYPFNAEREILRAHAGQIATASGAQALVELGSGAAEKTRWLLNALAEHGTLRDYLPMDVSEAALREASGAIAADYPRLTVHGIVGDFTRHLALLPRRGKRLLAFLGGTIGNLLPDDRAVFLRSVRASLGAGEQLLLGVGLVIDPAVMVPAYDDAQGVTAEFNRNVLRVLNRELGADFDLEAFTHVALWNGEREWIEMRLRAERRMNVRIAELGLQIPFAQGEELRTETSAKFRLPGVRAELAAAGLELSQWWTDTADRFAVALATAR